VIDVSFISLRLVLPSIARLATARHASPSPATGTVVALFKPQFEAARTEVLRDPQLHSSLIGRFAAWCVENGFRILALTSSPILGSEGNREFLFWLRPTAPVGAPLAAPALAAPGGESGETAR
jgi:23S rRNA (cytidine1920-2'-O)/16S rRNA (cytidine1409-2'-O)-methyltransferase